MPSRLDVQNGTSRLIFAEPFKSGGLVRTGDRLEFEALFGFVSVNQADYPAATMCRVLQVSKSGLYAWRRRGMSSRARDDI